MARELIDAFTRAIAEKTHAPGSPAAESERLGWSTRDLAQALGVSERSARRYKQTGHLPEARRADFDRASREAQRSRTRRQLERRGVHDMRVLGRYRVSDSRYETNPRHPAKLQPGRSIPPATMREVFDALDQGDADRANDVLEQALSEGYQASNPLHWERVDDLTYRIR